MAKASLKGFDDFLASISAIGSNTESIAREALYNGADIMANAVKEELGAIPTVSDNYNLVAYKSGAKMKLSHRQKKGLVESMGIAKFKSEANGKITTSIGFDGYNDIKTKKYPKGQPNALIARVVESGSTYMDKTPFLRKATNKAKPTVEEKMKETAENRLRERMEE